MSFWDLLKPAPATKAKSAAKPVTAAALELALAEAEAAAQAAEALAAEVAQERAGLLLGADDQQLDAIDRRLQLATRAADRAQAAVEALRQRLATAQEAEREAERDTLYAKGQAALDAGLALYEEYGELAARLAAIAEGMADRCDEIEAANKALLAAGDARRIADLDLTARPEVSDVRLGRLALWHQLALPSAEFPNDTIWPPHQQTRIKFPPPAPSAPMSPPPADDAFSPDPRVMAQVGLRRP